jgi:predicted MPP superfamily phosphohydrolase
MSIKKWVQLSDVHFGSPNNHTIIAMRERFIEKCQQLQEINYLFLTGDFRYGISQSNNYPDDIIDFLHNVQKCLGVSQDDTFMVPGNHDMVRSDGQEAIIKDIKGKYLPNRTIPSGYDQVLDPGRQQYLDLYEKVCGIRRKDRHFYIPKDELNIIHINTAVLCGKDEEARGLIIDMYALRDSLNGIDRTKPAIAIAHHPFNCLEDGEQEQLELLLKQFNTVLYLCGHKHVARCKNINMMKPNINLWEYVCGTNMENLSYQETAEIGFFTGYIDTELISGCVEGHKWSKKHNDWLPNDEFSFPQNGANDGKYYFPERIAVSKDYYDNSLLEKARSEYWNYLKMECGEIMLDGLPIDNEAGSKKIALEKLFVPLHFYRHEVTRNSKTDSNEQFINPHIIPSNIFENIIPSEGTFKLVVFSGPGGGKTTWMKRVSSVYGSGNHGDIEDHLPERTLFPIWIRCRQFKYGTPLSILDIIHGIPEQAGFGSDELLKEEFFAMACRNIQNGTALVLIDGLDEIGSTENRQEFISKLNKFAFTFNKANIIMTSRSVGYEQVAKNLAIDFTYYVIKLFEREDIERLCIGWHKIFSGEGKDIIAESAELSDTIINNEKIFNLAQTPVLLTTLLLVKRWVGQLPTKRIRLYEKAVEVLLNTWGADTRRLIHPINLDEALPLLAYLAHYMMFNKNFTIGKTELKKVLLEAHKNLSQIFTTAFSEEEVDQFIDHVEGRSELLVMRGYSKLDEDNEEPEKVYEFSHLTIQEYMAAFAIERGYYPDAKKVIGISGCLKNVFEENYMREVILLTSILTDWRGAEDIANELLKKLLHIRERRHIDRQERINYITNLLMQMIADEAQLTYNMRENIYKACFDKPIVQSMINGIMTVYNLPKYSKEMKNILETFDESRMEKVFVPLFRLMELRKKPGFSVFTYWLENIDSEIKSEALAVLSIAAWLRGEWLGERFNNIQVIEETLIKIYEGDDDQLSVLALCTLNSLYDDEDDIFSGKLLHRLFKLTDIWQAGMRYARLFPIKKDTVLHLQGISLSQIQKDKLKVRIDKENNTNILLGYFWFGILFGAWDLSTVIKMSKEYLTSDYILESELENLYERMKRYLSILKEANAIPSENKGLVKNYMDELEQQMNEIRKKNIINW